MNTRGLDLFELDNIERPSGRYWPELWPHETRDRIAGALHAAASGRTESFRAVRPTTSGELKWWDTVVVPVIAPGHSGPIEILVSSRDVTEEVVTRGFLDTIIHVLPADLTVRDVDGRLVLINRAAEQSLARSRASVLGKKVHELVSSDVAAVVARTDAQALATCGPVAVEDLAVELPGKGVRHYRLKTAATAEAGPRHVVTIAEDITELREAIARAEGASQAKSGFLATMSHEIRTPLNGILGMAQAMHADELSPEQRSRLRVLRRSGETLLAVLNDILDFSKIEAGKMQFAPEDFDLPHLVRGALAAFAPLAEAKGVPVRLRITEEAAGVCHGDPTRVRQVLYNLLSNAVKFTERGRIEVAARRVGQGIVLTVTDTGVGIHRDVLPRIFDQFVQGDASTTRRFGGSGLGLSICRELVELMGGSIYVTSKPGVGSKFKVSLPLPRASAPFVEASIGSDGGGAPTLQKRQEQIRVLAAEDNTVNQQVLTTLLLQIGIDPVIVDNGVQAVDAWTSGGWDVVLLDVQMPEMDGPSAARAIRNSERESGRRRTPIIAVTANAMPHQLKEYEAAGIDDVVVKPINVARLYEALERALGMTAPSHKDPESLAVASPMAS